MPVRIPLFPNLNPEQYEEALMKWRENRTPKAIRRLISRYVVFKKDYNNVDFAQWNPDATPSTRDVKQMLDWYTVTKTHYFPRVKSVKLLGVGFTNVYFVVRFYTPQDTPGEGPMTLPEKLYLRFTLPLHYPEDAMPWAGPRLEHEIATMSWVAEYNSLTPKIYLFDSFAQNQLQLEWLMMEPVQGFVLEKCIDNRYCTCETGLQGFAPVGMKAPAMNRDAVAKTFSEIHGAFKKMTFARPEQGKVIAGFHVHQGTCYDFLGRVVSKQFDVAARISKIETSSDPFPSFEHYFDAYFDAVYHDMDSGDRHIRKMKLYSTLEARGTPCRKLFSYMHRKNVDPNSDEPLLLRSLNLHTGNVLVDEHGHVVAVLGWEDAVVFPLEWLKSADELNQGLLHCTNDPLFRPLRSVMESFDLIPRGSRRPKYELGFDHGCPDHTRDSQTHFRPDHDRTATPKTPRTPITPVKEMFGKVFKELRK
ncbi:hypothetical protein CkaCkLH20_12106 [Colletotrichum karsti]|uniref:Aminoglycoside phosphotransferase domain-containing protein n=1 Tax=Colletotrichum karsti TaxID=1095194 RepID=A0A9P6HUA2_9PEZI|nr:uncharacterized protein CkaCkLH20_12106 [Colletotrichum karsti]KAF9870439.1 hypothetical protein CkaCkLH20_12106 [Colletotrichum karsti]